MDIQKELSREKAIILEAISSAAREGQVELLLANTERLERIERLIDRNEAILRELIQIRDMEIVPKAVIRDSNAESNTRSSQQSSSRIIGANLRKDFLRKREAEGIALELIKGKTIFRTNSGETVGIAVATERQPNRWFLGLPENGFDHAVLLCQKENGEVIDVPLPHTFFAEFAGKLSVSKGQVKFNVLYDGSDLIVQVPGTRGVKSKSIAKEYSFLK